MLLLLVVVILASVLIYQSRRARFARAVRVDSKLVCFVRDERAAEAVRTSLLQTQKGNLPGSAFLEQKWEDLNWPLDKDDKVLSVTQAAEALRPKVTIKVAAAAVKSGDTELTVLPSKEDAELALRLLKKEYSTGTGKVLQTDFLEKESIRIADTKAQPKAIITDVHEAVDQLKTSKEGVEKHVVAQGETLGTIAEKYSTSVAKLRSLNTGVGDVIHPGDKLTVSVPRKPITVVTTMEETREAAYTLPRVTVETPSLAKGEKRVAVEPVPGTKQVVDRVTYHSGKEVARKTIKEAVTKPAIAEKVIVGTAEPDAT